MNTLIRPLALVAAGAAIVTQPIAAQAQFRDLFNDARRGASQAEGCDDGKSGDTARGVVGGILGGIGRRTVRRAGVPTFVPLTEFSDTITTEIACKLEPEEQEQAAEATLEATRGSDEEGLEGPPVGQSSSWTSEKRKGVSGTSTVTAREDKGEDSDGSDCITVTDVVIIEGEETKAEKRMCRLAGAARYSIVA